MENRIQRLFLALIVSAMFSSTAYAQQGSDEQGASAESQETIKEDENSVLDEIITPDMERRVIERDVLDHEDFEIGVYAGVLSVEDFGSNSVTGIRLAYHVTEDFFLETTYAQSTLQETSFERLSGSTPLFTDEQRELDYYNLSIGYNILPGEVFIGSNWAFNSNVYLVLGAGNTSFADEEHFTYSFGAGMRFFMTDWLALHADVRDHIFSHDLLGEEITTQNLEVHMGMTLFF